MSKQTRAIRPKNYLLQIDFMDSRVQKIRFQSHASAMEKMAEFLRYIGVWVHSVSLTYLVTGEVVGVTSHAPTHPTAADDQSSGEV